MKKVESKSTKKSIDYQRAAKLFYRQRKTLKEALTTVGVSEGQAARGRVYMARHSKRFAKAFGREARQVLAEAESLGSSLNDGQILKIVRGRLLTLSAEGEGDAKGAVQATMGLGKLRGVQAFEPDQNIGINIFDLPIPKSMEKHYVESTAEPKEYFVTPPARSIGDPLPKPKEPPLLEAKTVRTQLSLEQEIEEIKRGAGEVKK